MSDDRTQRGKQDRERINVNQQYEVRDWAAKLGVPPGVVRQAVKAVGDKARDVEQYIGRHQN